MRTFNAKTRLTTADEQECWEQYCAALNLNAAASLRDLRDENQWADYWDHVFAALDQRQYARQAADEDAVVYGQK